MIKIHQNERFGYLLSWLNCLLDDSVFHGEYSKCHKENFTRLQLPCKIERIQIREDFESSGKAIKGHYRAAFYSRTPEHPDK